jgi:hypothetical protein
MKPNRITSILTAVLLSLGITGCAFLKQHMTPEVVGTLCETIASTGTAVRLAEHPDDAPRFALAKSTLDLLIADGRFSAADLQAALNTLPVDKLKGSTGELIIDGALNGALLVVQLATGGQTPIESAPYVKAAAIGLRDGIASALPAATPTQSVMFLDLTPGPLAVIAQPRTITLHYNQAVSIDRVTYWGGSMPCQAPPTKPTQVTKTLWIIPPGTSLRVGTITITAVK